MGTLDRRQLLVGAAGALVLAACGRSDDSDVEEVDVALQAPPAAPPELDTNTPAFDEEARVFFVVVPASIRARAKALLPPAAVKALDHGGLLALSDVCPADKLQLRHCPTSAWFQCPACGSLFDALGDRKGGPAPHGMSLHAVEVGGDGEVTVRARPRYDGLPPGTSLVQHGAAGPHCS